MKESLFVLLMGCSSLAYAIPPPVLLGREALKVNEPKFDGNGCPEGSASVLLDMDKKSLSILFDRFQAQSGKAAQKGMEQKNCIFAIPMTVEPGISVSVTRVDYRGFNSLPPGATAVFSVWHRFVTDSIQVGQGGNGQLFRGPLRDDFLIYDAAVFKNKKLCGREIAFTTQISMTVSSSKSEDALVSLDSADARTKTPAGIVYSLAFAHCEPGQ